MRVVNRGWIQRVVEVIAADMSIGVSGIIVAGRVERIVRLIAAGRIERVVRIIFSGGIIRIFIIVKIGVGILSRGCRGHMQKAGASEQHPA